MDPFDKLTTNQLWKLHWQMSTADRCALQIVLQQLRPALSLEVGTYRGGSLQALAEHSTRVISIDINPRIPNDLAELFQNVSFRTGNSSDCLPKLVDELNVNQEPVSFVLIDGDHTASGVNRDITAALSLNIHNPLVILIHDSFNPDCREGMKNVAWSENCHVHCVELDFTVGNFHADSHDTASARSMWGGFACAILRPEPRKHDLQISERNREIHNTMRSRSRHAKNIFTKLRNRARSLLNQAMP